MQKRCDRNRNRSKRRAIYCPIHHHFLDSASAKHPLFADQAGQLQARGIGRKNSLLLMSSAATVLLQGEWIEAFWCEDCQAIKWYHVRKCERTYTLSVAPPELWQQAAGVFHPDGNASVSEFTRKQSRTPTTRNIYMNSI